MGWEQDEREEKRTQKDFNHFIRGFNFYNPGRKLDEAMNMNFTHNLWYGEYDIPNNFYNIPTIKNYVIQVLVYLKN
ncbi:MAG: hypothetical protein EPN82_09165 [Bacteroidetes bacterium]|nr:MAG: hypothetical protein EPN82_09165 [Bacteroidota bacterium]